MWKLKVLIQFVLAKLPGGEQINYLFQRLFKEHSSNKIGQHVINTAKRLVAINEYVRLNGSTVVEIGTGWNAVGAILLYLMGAETVYTYDHIPHVRYELVRTVINSVESRIDQISSITSISKFTLYERLSRLRQTTSTRIIFERANISYQAPGDAQKTGLPARSVDLVYSNAVLEHVPEEVINGLMIEAERILRKNGIVYHRIGLHDHYNFDKNVTKVNFLKYSEPLWAFFVKNKISYHNRLREKQFIEIFKAHGAKIIAVKSETDPADLDTLKNMKIDKRFSGMTHAELAVYCSEVIFSF